MDLAHLSASVTPSPAALPGLEGHPGGSTLGSPAPSGQSRASPRAHSASVVLPAKTRLPRVLSSPALEPLAPPRWPPLLPSNVPHSCGSLYAPTPAPWSPPSWEKVWGPGLHPVLEELKRWVPRLVGTSTHWAGPEPPERPRKPACTHYLGSFLSTEETRRKVSWRRMATRCATPAARSANRDLAFEEGTVMPSAPYPPPSEPLGAFPAVRDSMVTPTSSDLQIALALDPTPPLSHQNFPGGG